MPKEKKNETGKVENSKNNSLKTIIIIILVVMVVIGGILIGFLIGGRNSSKDKKATNETRKELKVFALDSVTVNLSDDGGKRYVKIQVSFGYEENSKLETELKNNKDIPKDSVISIVRSKKSSEIDASHEKVIKEDIKTKVNSILIHGQIEEVYFVDILIQ